MQNFLLDNKKKEIKRIINNISKVLIFAFLSLFIFNGLFFCKSSAQKNLQLQILRIFPNQYLPQQKTKRSPWQKENSISYLQPAMYRLFCESKLLEDSCSLLQKGKPEQARSKLINEIESMEKENPLAGQTNCRLSLHLNNLAATEILGANLNVANNLLLKAGNLCKTDYLFENHNSIIRNNLRILYSLHQHDTIPRSPYATP